jgi:phosphotransacetylase
MGLRRPVNVLAHATTAAEIVNVAAITAVSADATIVPSVQPAVIPTGR